MPVRGPLTYDDHIRLGHVRVIGIDKMCFWVTPDNLEPVSGSCFDPWCYSDSLPCKSMGVNQWDLQKSKRT